MEAEGLETLRAPSAETMGAEATATAAEEAHQGAMAEEASEEDFSVAPAETAAPESHAEAPTKTPAHPPKITAVPEPRSKPCGRIHQTGAATLVPFSLQAFVPQPGRSAAAPTGDATGHVQRLASLPYRRIAALIFGTPTDKQRTNSTRV